MAKALILNTKGFNSRSSGINFSSNPLLKKAGASEKKWGIQQTAATMGSVNKMAGWLVLNIFKIIVF